MNSNDLLAKLLANENLTVVRGNVVTASFDIGKRVLVLPQWKDMPEITEEMLILHEVGHALFTTEEYSLSQEGKDRIFGHYLNVVEDARIERKMKQRYPGSRKSFIQGYKDLNDRDFFKIKDIDLNTMSIIDRINLFYKAGMNCGVKFNNEEMKFIIDIDRAETIKQVIDIAERLYDYAKATAQEEVEMEMLDNIDFDNQENISDGYDDLDDQLNGGQYNEIDSDDEEVKEDNTTSGTSGASDNKEYEKEKRINNKIESSTVKALEENLNSSADTNTVYNYYEPEFGFSIDKDPIIGFKRVLSEMKADIALNRSIDDFSYITQKAIKFKEENNSIVNNMVKEFEMRKSASAWKRAQISKTGQLDPKKLFGYKIKDELFKQLTVVKNGKQHGMLMLLDWSGSMDQYMLNTIKQMINLVMFARRINIPFQVFAFSSNYNNSVLFNYSYDHSTHNANGLGNATNITLFELFSNKMNEREMVEMSSYLLNNVWHRSNEYSLGATPLNEALLIMTKYVGKFIKNNSIEKAIFITLTDGEGNSLTPYSREKSLNGYSSAYIDNKLVQTRQKSFIKDSVTGKQYEIDQYSESHTRALLNIVRDRYDTINIGFNIVPNSFNALTRFVRNVVGKENYDIYNIQTSMRAHKYYNMPYSGYTKYYLIDNKGLNVDNTVDLQKVNSDMNANQMSKTLGKVMNHNKATRVVLNNFVSEIA